MQRREAEPDPHAATQAAGGSSEDSERAVVGDRYVLLALLGAGGMGNVYKARDLELDELVALKVLRPEIASGPGALDRFRREVKLARRVTHPNVARVFDIGEQGGQRVLTMELVDGEPLSAMIERERPLPLARSIEIVSAVCAGVGAAHAAGVVHRDLKPDNVLLAKDGRVVVSDFGIARVAAPTETAGTAGNFVGTPAYMAPEQVEGKPVDERADVYALGVMIYEMIVGERPWQGESGIAIAAARLLHPPPDPRVARRDLSPRVADLILRCMARRPEDRFGKMSEIAAVLATVTPSSSLASLPEIPRAEPGLAIVASEKRVAVLPFQNLGATENDYVAEGLTDDLIDVLSVARGLRVHSRGAVARYKGRDRDAREIGRELGVQVVVEGSVRKTPEAFRINARLISVADGLQLWARRFDGKESEMLALNDEVARAVADALTADLEAPGRSSMDPVAIDFYLRARLNYNRHYFSSQVHEALSLYEQALARAPDDPRVIAGWAMARARVMQNDEMRSLARSRAERALSLAPSLPEAHAALGAVLFHADQPAEAVRSLRRALRLASNNAEVHDLIGRILNEAKGEESVRHFETAIALEPEISLPRVYLVRHYALLGDWDRVDSLLMDPANSRPAIMTPHRARLILWRRDARAAAELAPSVEPTNGPFRVAKKWLALTMGEPVTVEDFATPVGAGRRSHAFYAQIRAEYFSFVGQSDQAARELAVADENGLIDLHWLDGCPILESVRAHPRYAEVHAHVAARAEQVRAAYRAKDL
jgi:serine/threonine-protein kinase